MPSIERVSAIPVVVPIDPAQVHDPAFMHEPLNHGPKRWFDGEWIGNVPFYIIKVESDGGPPGWCDTVRGQDPDLIRGELQKLLGRTPSEVKPTTALFASPYLRGVQTAALDWAARSM